LITIDSETGEPTVLYGPKSGMSELDKENLKDLRHQRDQLEKTTGKSRDEDAEIRDKLNAINYKLEAIKRGKPAAAPTKSKVDRAHEISAEHPDWTKEQVVKAVNAELQ